MGSSSIAECVKALKSDRLITLNIGNSNTSFSVQVQQGVLEAASPWFRDTLRWNRFIEGHSSVINFPEDDTTSWEILLYWLLHHGIPINDNDGDNATYFVSRAKCWVLGDKYGIRGFQNEAMFQLLKCASAVDTGLQPAHYEELISVAPADSGLMRLLGEEAAYQYNHGPLRASDATKMDAGTSFWPIFLTAHEKMREDETYLSHRFSRIEHFDEEKAHWRDYMVGELPSSLEYVCNED